MQLGHFTNLPALDPVEIIMEAIADKTVNKRKSGLGIKHWLRKTP